MLGVRALSCGYIPLIVRNSGKYSIAMKLGNRKNRFGKDKGSI